MEYEVDDIGTTCEVNIPRIGEVTFSFLEKFTFDEESEKHIKEILENWSECMKDLPSKVSDYLKKTYNKDSIKYSLLEVYIDVDDDYGTFGLMFRLDIDVEHGLGIKFEDFCITKIGPADTAFLR